jgi:hypothetical protein
MLEPGSDLPQTGGEEELPPTPPMPPSRSKASPEFLYFGLKFGLAHGRDYFAIFRRGAPSWKLPLYAFPRDTLGWESAWKQFCRLEPRSNPTVQRVAQLRKPA